VRFIPLRRRIFAENIITADRVIKTGFLSENIHICRKRARAASLYLPQKWLSGRPLLLSSSTTEEQIALRKILLQRRIQAKVHPYRRRFFKNVIVKTRFRLKIL
jgi:hypothetical protein